MQASKNTMTAVTLGTSLALLPFFPRRAQPSAPQPPEGTLTTITVLLQQLLMHFPCISTV